MSAFYIGQRVRIKWSENWPELAGQEGLVVGVGVVSLSAKGEVDGCLQVAPDSWGTCVAPRPGSILGTYRFGPSPEQLEPITPPGLESLAEINALYESEPVSA